MKNYIRKFLLLLVVVKYPKVRKEYKYFIRDNYYCRLLQFKYLYKDYVKKEKYKTIEFQGEFDQEIRYVMPYAYWHYLNGTLKKTISCKGTKEFYFFSDNHEERYDERLWEKSYTNFTIPNMTHSISFSYRKWKRIPFREHYSNTIFRYSKPTLVIANKYNVEWEKAPLNFLDIPTLDSIISRYKEKYQIIYNRPLPSQIVEDNSAILDLKEHQWLREAHPEVILMDDLYRQYQNMVNNFNHLQLMVYANCSHYISMHGGTGALASCFGGVNIILSKRGIEHELKEFDTIVPMLSGAKILHAKTETEILEYLSENY